MFKICYSFFIFFFFNDTATTEIYTLSLHDALPICIRAAGIRYRAPVAAEGRADLGRLPVGQPLDRKSTRLNSSHLVISYAVFCLKKKTKKNHIRNTLTRHDHNVPVKRSITNPLHTN